MQKDHLTEIDPSAAVTEQACHWWVVLNCGDASPADHRRFGEWVARSPERIEAFLEVARLTRALDAGRIRWPGTPIEELIREARAADGDAVCVPFRNRRGGVEHGQRTFAPAATPIGGGIGSMLRPHITFAASGLVAAAAGFLLLTGPQTYRTALGEQRSILLNDGSIVTLNTSSTIEVRMAARRRRVTLISGEALFRIAHDASRPFYVTTGSTTIRAVGTQFDVDRRRTSTTVTVVEGKVAVFVPSGAGPAPGSRPAAPGAQTLDSRPGSGLPLVAGEQLTVTGSAAPRRGRADVAAATAWTQRKLVFEHRPLGDVAEELNRYNRRTIEIRSAALRDQEVTGVFRADDPASFVDFLSKLPGVTVDLSDDGMHYVVDRRSPPEEK